MSGVVGPDVSKTEGIKASVAWGISKKPCDCLVFSVSRCMTLGLISSVLDTWRTHCAVPAPESGPPRSGPGWGGALEGVGLVVDEGLRRQREFKADHEGRDLVIGDEVGVEGGSHRRRLDPPRRFRPPLPRRPGLDQPRLPPSTLEDRPRTTDTTCRNTRESSNKTSAFGISLDSPAHSLHPA